MKDANGWTGGQWSLVRVTLALGAGAIVLSYLGAPMLHPRTSTAGMAVLAFASVFVVLVTVYVALGIGRTGGALLLAGLLGVALAGALPPYAWGVLTDRDRSSPPTPTLIAVALVVHGVLFAILIPPEPYGSWAARRRADPAGGWAMPRPWHLFAAVSWLAYVASLATTLSSTFGLRRIAWGEQWPDRTYTALLIALIPLYWFARTVRPYVWLLTVAFLVAGCWWPGWWLILGFGALPALLAFDPGWIRPRHAGTTDTLFYDGGCGLCHTSVRFILAEDRSGSAFTFAPIGGAAWHEAFPDERAAPTQTLVVRTARGETLSRSTGALYIARRLGGFWRVFGTLGIAIPRPLRDGTYNLIARVRHRLFRAPSEACPLVPPEMRARFDLRP